jgi:hypothetical protein
MDFPARRTTSVPTPPGLVEALGTRPLDVVTDAGNYLAVLESEKVVRELGQTSRRSHAWTAAV